MAAKTLYLKDALAAGSNHGSLQDGGSAPTTATSTTGWVAGTLVPTRYARQGFGDERASSNLLTSPVQPDGGPDNTLGDCWRTEQQLSGSFAAANWNFSVPVIGVSRSTSTTDGQLRLRVWRASDPTGAAASEITTASVVTTAFANLANSIAQTLTVTASLPAATLAGEYLFLQVAFELTGAGNNAQADVHIRVGSASTVTTSDFTETVALAGTGDTITSGAGLLALAVPVAGGSSTASAGTGSLSTIQPRTWGDADARWGDWETTWDGTPRQPDRSVNLSGGSGTLSLQVPLATGLGWTSTWPAAWWTTSATTTSGSGTLVPQQVPLAGASTTTTAGGGDLAVPLEGDSVTTSDGSGTLDVPTAEGAPDAILAATNLDGVVAEIQDDPAAPGLEWLTAAEPSAATDLRVSFPTPATPPGSGGPRRMVVLVRRPVDPTAPDPQVTLELWEGGVFKATLVSSVAVTSTSGQLVEATLDPADLTDPSGAGVELRVRGVPT